MAFRCLYCGTELRERKNTYNKYCDNQCQRKHKYDLNIAKWKNGEHKGYGAFGKLSTTIRKYLFIKYNNRCCKCGWHEVNEYTGLIPLEVSHIDGDYTNCKEENLELICPNCHSLTPNYRSRNKIGNVRNKGNRGRNLEMMLK